MQGQLDESGEEIEDLIEMSDLTPAQKQSKALVSAAAELLADTTLDASPLKKSETSLNKAENRLKRIVLPSTKWPKNLLEHSLSPARGDLKNLGESDCSICYTAFNQVEILAQLPCLHHFCYSCIEQLEKAAADSSPSCPTCRRSFLKHEAKPYRDFRAAERHIPLICTNPDCLWDDTSSKLIGLADEKRAPPCPYPSGQLSDCPAQNFLCVNASLIFGWLKEQFLLKGYKITRLAYMDRLGDYFDRSKISEKKVRDSSGIALNVKSPDGVKRELYFATVHINKGDSPKDWFFNLVKDYRTDFLITTLMSSHPAAFNHDTTMFITDYNFWDDTLTIRSLGTNHVLSLSNIWTPLKKSFSFSQLKNAMSLKGLDYSELFNPTVVRYADRELGVIYRAGTSTLYSSNEVIKKGGKRAAAKNIEIPDDELLLDIP